MEVTMAMLTALENLEPVPSVHQCITQFLHKWYQKHPDTPEVIKKALQICVKIDHAENKYIKFQLGSNPILNTLSSSLQFALEFISLKRSFYTMEKLDNLMIQIQGKFGGAE